jgi:hypothetical protein
VRAATAVEAVLAEEAVLMAEALAVADVALVSTFATEDADNIRQQTTINSNDRGDVVAVVTKATTAVAAATQRWQ